MGNKNYRNWLSMLLQPIFGYVIAAGTLIALLSFRLGTLVKGLSVGEASLANHSTYEALRLDPFYAPYKVLQKVILSVAQHSPFTIRLSSVIFGTLTVLLFYYVAQHWFNARVSLLSTILLASSAWFLHYARLADPTISQTFIIALAAYGTWLRTKQYHPMRLIIGSFLVAMLLYIPGFVWIVVVGLIWQRQSIKKEIQSRTLQLVVAALLLLMLLTPLFLSSLARPDLLYRFLGLAGSNLHELIRIPQNLFSVPVQILLHGPNNPTLWLGRLPLLDFFSLIMAILGAYNFAMNWKLDRSRFVFWLIGFVWLAIGLGGPVSIVALLPLLYLLVASGIDFMLRQWFRVFPFNPFARSLAIVLVIAALVTVGWYNVQHYFVAWPQTPETKRSFTEPL